MAMTGLVRRADWSEIFGDEAMAAALIDRLVHHCHIVTIRGNSYRMRQHSDLWHALHTPDAYRPQTGDAALVRRWRRTRLVPSRNRSDFQSAEVSDFGPALTTKSPVSDLERLGDVSQSLR
jgi:hypothetical protein